MHPPKSKPPDRAGTAQQSRYGTKVVCMCASIQAMLVPMQVHQAYAALFSPDGEG